MTNWLTKQTIKVMLENNTIPESSCDVYEYGLNILIYTVLSTLFLLLIGCLWGLTLECLIIIAIFYTCQTIGGGYHASTHLQCFITMSTGLSIILFGIRFHFYHIALCNYLTVFSALVLLAKPVVLHKSKEYLAPSINKYEMLSRLVTISLASIYLIFITLYHLFSSSLIQNIVVSFSYTLFCASISRLVGALRSKIEGIVQE